LPKARLVSRQSIWVSYLAPDRAIEKPNESNQVEDIFIFSSLLAVMNLEHQIIVFSD